MLTYVLCQCIFWILFWTFICVVLIEIHTSENRICWLLVKLLFELNILPTCQIIVQNKGIQMRLQVP